MGQEVEVRPGIVTKDSEGRAQCIPIYSRIVSLKAESNDLQYAVPGGLIGVGTTVRGSRTWASDLAGCLTDVCWSPNLPWDLALWRDCCSKISHMLRSSMRASGRPAHCPK